MIAIDTCILVRLLTRDDPEQARVAESLMRSQPLFLPKTVLLELAWVLAYTYRFDRTSIHGAFTRLLGLDNLRVEDPEDVALAVGWYGQGLDFADALHLASAGEAREFATFDRRLAARAEGIVGAIPVRGV